MDALAAALADCKARGVQPKMIYTIPTVQNPTATILPEQRRAELLRLSEEYGVAVFEDDCYSDLIWDGKRPPALYAMSKSQNVIHCGSFSKSIAPALRVGFMVAPWEFMSRMLPFKTDAGSARSSRCCSLTTARSISPRTCRRCAGLAQEVETLMETLNEHSAPRPSSRIRKAASSCG